MTSTKTTGASVTVSMLLGGEERNVTMRVTPDDEFYLFSFDGGENWYAVIDVDPGDPSMFGFGGVWMTAQEVVDLGGEFDRIFGE